jgi:hypothetical protein
MSVASSQRSAARPEPAEWVSGQRSVPRPAIKGSAEWVGGQRSFLTPTLAAWQWLNTSHSERLQTLWTAWLSPNPDRWAAFRLPGYTWLRHPARLIAAINEALSRETKPQQPDQPDPSLLPSFQPATFSRRLLTVHPDLLDLVPSTIPDPIELLAETTLELLTGSLVWLGILEKAEGERLKDVSFQPSAFSLQLPPPAKFAVALSLQPNPFDSALILTPGVGLPDPADLVTAIQLSEPEQESDSLGRLRSEVEGQGTDFSPAPPPLCPPAQITAASFIRAIHRAIVGSMIIKVAKKEGPPLSGGPFRRQLKPADRNQINRNSPGR